MDQPDQSECCEAGVHGSPKPHAAESPSSVWRFVEAGEAREINSNCYCESDLLMLTHMHSQRNYTKVQSPGGYYAVSDLLSERKDKATATVTKLSVTKIIM